VGPKRDTHPPNCQNDPTYKSEERSSPRGVQGVDADGATGRGCWGRTVKGETRPGKDGRAGSKRPKGPEVGAVSSLRKEEKVGVTKNVRQCSPCLHEGGEKVEVVKGGTEGEKKKMTQKE